MHATDDVLDAIDATVVLPTRANHFSPLVYSRYLRRALERADFLRAWQALLKQRADTQHCLVWGRGGGLRRANFVS